MLAQLKRTGSDLIVFVTAIFLLVSVAERSLHAASKILPGASSYIKSGQAGNFLDHLANKIGSRTAGSEAHVRACEWAESELKKIGLANVHKEICIFQPVYDSTKVREAGEDLNFPMQNVIADIPGTDLADEYVLFGAHIDSHGPGTGAQDNGSGVATLMEAARILTDAGVKPRRTIRFILFGGEEAGLLGSQSYAASHPDIVAKTSAMFTMDLGSNPITGIQVTGPIKSSLDNLEQEVDDLDTDIDFKLNVVDSLTQSAYVDCSGMGKPNAETQGTMGGISFMGAAAPVSKRVVVAGAAGCGAASAASPGCGTPIAVSGCGGPSGEWSGGGQAFGTSDHLPFLQAGIPAFIFEQVGPDTYYAHTGEDVFKNVHTQYLQYSAVVIAMTGLKVANLDNLLQRDHVGTTSIDLSNRGSK